jgi:hypothetical protein
MPEGNEGILDRVKDAAGRITDKMRDLLGSHGDKVDDGIDSAGDFVDDKTGGRFSEHVDKVQDIAHDTADKLAGEGDSGGGPGK